jgi:uncharacterized OB-fold protein
MPVALTICDGCGQAYARPVLRCGSCGSSRLKSRDMPGDGIVVAATRTAAERFAIVQLDGLRVLAHADHGEPLSIGESVSVEREPDATFRLVLP